MTERPEGPDEGLREALSKALREAWTACAHCIGHCECHVDAVLPLFTADRERTWDEGYTSGHSNVMRRMSDEPNAPTTPNPYRPRPATEGDNRG